MARPKPKRASGSAESSSIARWKASLRDPGAELDQCGKAEDEVHAFEVRREVNAHLGGFARALAIAEHKPDLAEPRPGKRIFRLSRRRLEQRLARALQIEIRLLRIGQRDVGRRNVGLELHAALGVFERASLVVLHDLDDGPQGIGKSRMRVRGDRPIDDRPRLVDAADGEKKRGLIEIEGAIAMARRHPLQRGEGAGNVVLARRAPWRRRIPAGDRSCLSPKWRGSAGNRGPTEPSRAAAPR